MNKILEEYLYDLTKQFDNSCKNNFSANYIASELGLNRSTVSNYLNEAFRSNEVIKIKEYPVLFLHKKALEEKNYILKKREYSSIEKMMYQKEDNSLNSVIGFKGSLKEAINQVKTAVLYPNNGLPLLILGSSGSGKTFLANKIHSFSIENEVIDANSPFISLNCSQYFNNPELLSSALFGHVKGAFTGAEKEHIGLIEKANGGILFLDEVHRLNDEGQEKLFTFMDSGYFSPIGDTSIQKKAKVRLMFATTEDISSTFLPTFLRRLPVIVTLPKFKNRPQAEKLQLIDTFFIDESTILGKKLEVSSQVVSFLLSADFEGNIGKIKNIIKYLCGNAYTKRKPNDNQIKIRLSDLPIEYSLKYKDFFDKFQRKIPNRQYSPNSYNEIELESPEIKKLDIFFSNLINEFQNMDKQKEWNLQFIDKLSNNVVQILDEYMFKELYNKEESFYSVLTYQIKKTLEYMNDNLYFDQDGNRIISLASYLYIKNNKNILDSNSYWASHQDRIIEFFKQHLNNSYFYAKKILSHLSQQLDQPVLLEDILFFSLYLHSLQIKEMPNGVKSIILAHGYSTASSLANVGNRMLGKNIFQCYDMPLDISFKNVEAEVTKFINDFKTDSGIVLLVDMGSLIQLGENLSKHVSSPLIIIDHVSTPLVLEVGNHIMNGKTVMEINELIETQDIVQKKLILPKLNKKKVILTCCYTGMGNAIQIQDILQKSFIDIKDEITVIPYDYKKLLRNKLYETPFQIYDVLAIIGTESPKINQLPYIGIQDLISGESVDELVHILNSAYDVNQKKLREALLFNFSINKIIENLTILDASKILTLVQDAIKKLEIIKKTTYTNHKLFVIYIHCCSMVERILRKETIDTQDDMENYIVQEKNNLNILSSVFKTIENEYTIKIPDNELRLVNEILEG